MWVGFLCHLMQRGCKGSEVRDKTLIIAHKSQECFYLSLSCWPRPGGDGLHFLELGSYTAFPNSVAEVFCLL